MGEDTQKPRSPAAKAPTASNGYAFRSPLAVAVFLAVCAAGSFADLYTKQAAFSHFLDDPTLPAKLEHQSTWGATTRQLLSQPQYFQTQLFPGVRITLSTNPGIVFGNNLLPRWVVNMLTLATIALVCLFFATSDRRAWPLHLAFACIIGGALGNLYDRLWSVVAVPVQGAAPITCEVRDFIDLSQIGYPWIFNIADVLLVMGVGIIMLSWLFTKNPSKAVAGSK